MIARKIFLTLILTLTGLGMAACGFTPVYGNFAGSSQTKAALSQVSVDNIPDRTGQKLRNLLIDRMYMRGRPAGDVPYRLKVGTVAETIYGLGIAKDATATRSQIRLNTTINLTNADGTMQYFRRYLTAVSSFNTLASQYTTLVTEEDARDQVIRDLAEQIITQLELYFGDPAAFPEALDLTAPVEEAAGNEEAAQ